MNNSLKWPIWVGVVCEDLEAQRRFYRDTLGMQELRAEDGFVWFSMEGRIFELLQLSSPAEYDRKRVVAGFAVDDIFAARDAMIARGAHPITEVNGGPEVGQYWAYFEDAEHNLFSLAQRISTG